MSATTLRQARKVLARLQTDMEARQWPEDLVMEQAMEARIARLEAGHFEGPDEVDAVVMAAVEKATREREEREAEWRAWEIEWEAEKAAQQAQER